MQFIHADDAFPAEPFEQETLQIAVYSSRPRLSKRSGWLVRRSSTRLSATGANSTKSVTRCAGESRQVEWHAKFLEHWNQNLRIDRLDWMRPPGRANGASVFRATVIVAFRSCFRSVVRRCDPWTPSSRVPPAISRKVAAMNSPCGSHRAGLSVYGGQCLAMASRTPGTTSCAQRFSVVSPRLSPGGST